MRGPKETPLKKNDEIVIDAMLDSNSGVEDVDSKQEIMLYHGKISNHDKNHQL